MLEVTPDRFRTDFAADGSQVFVYGREVNMILTGICSGGSTTGDRRGPDHLASCHASRLAAR